MAPRPTSTPSKMEWPTLGLAVLCYVLFWLGTVWLPALWLPAGIAVTALAVALHASLTHEILHGHPTPWQKLNEALVFPALGLLVPYLRFRDTHLAHHQDSRLTDPYDDPETNYLDPEIWERLRGWQRALYRANNTLLGRLLLGTGLGQVVFMRNDWRAIQGGDRSVRAGWAWHVPALIPVGLWLTFVAGIPFWAYGLAVYVGLSIIKIRTFLEHQAHETARGRTVVIEDRGPLAWLFLNNNLHVVHHMHPRVAWYRLPTYFRANRDRYLTVNQGYSYSSYAEVFRRYFLRAKDPVPHPFFPRS